MLTEVKELTYKIESIVGPNVAYMRADEENRPLSIGMAEAFAAHLLVVFLIAFAKRLGADLTNEAADILWSRIKKLWGPTDISANRLTEAETRAASEAGQHAVVAEIKKTMPVAPPIVVQTISVEITTEIHQRLVAILGQGGR